MDGAAPCGAIFLILPAPWGMTMPKSKAKPRAAEVAMAAYSIKQFCAAHGISERYYYKMKQQGIGPREMQVGRKRRLISLEAAAEWRRVREG